jgi:tripeptidyl-peptidase-1
VAGHAKAHEIHKWERNERAVPTDFVHMYVAIKHTNVDKLYQTLRDVSSPQSPSYGHYLTSSQVGQLIAPLPAHVQAVREWVSDTLKASNIVVNPNQDWLRCSVRVADFEEACQGAEFFYFSHPLRQNRIVRSVGAFRVPSSVADAVDIIAGVADFPSVRSRRADPFEDVLNGKVHTRADVGEGWDWWFQPVGGDSVLSIVVAAAIGSKQPTGINVLLTLKDGEQYHSVYLDTDNAAMTVGKKNNLYTYMMKGLSNGHFNISIQLVDGNDKTSWWQYGTQVLMSPWITASVVHNLYGIPPGEISQYANNSQSVAEFDGQYYSPSDVASFAKLMNIPEAPVVLVGPNQPNKPGGESTLDIEWIMTTGLNITTTFWSVAEGFLAEWVSEVLASPNPPLVHSISYGEAEELISQSSVDRFNEDFAQMGTMGLTIISTSGDIGVSDGFVRGCNSDTPDFPSASPYTLSLGATALARDYSSPMCTEQNPLYLDSGPTIMCDWVAEVSCSAQTGQGFTTGGGFSEKSKQPWYQQDAVNEYLSTNQNLPPSTWFNAAGRGFNDVTALGSNILIVQNGKISSTGGTSASGPIVAGIMALLNDNLLRQGSSPLGFANPLLYAIAAEPAYKGAFNPVTKGDNRCKELDGDGNAVCCQYGFYSNPGWDPDNGLGSPQYMVLKEAVLAAANGAFQRRV